MKKLLPFAFACLLFVSCGDDKKDDSNVEQPTTKAPQVKQISYNIIAEYPHDTASYTQGLEFYNGKLYEGSGDFTNSALQFGEAKTGSIEKKHKMGSTTIFGEGITIINGKLYQLTWQSHDVFVYDIKDITKVIQKFTWPYEGWGLTNNGTDLIITTGGTDLYFVDPTTFKVKNTVHIHDESGPFDSVNELEFVDGFIYANVYTTKDIVKIDPKTGAIVGKMNFSTLPDPKDFIEGRTDYFNGIAYNPATKTFFVTGKRWNKIYEVRLN